MTDPATIALSAIAAVVLAVMALHGHAVNRKRLDSLNRHYREINDE